LEVSEWITIEDKVQVEAEFTSNTTTLFAGDELILSNTSLGATIYEWTINGELFNTTNLNYTFASAGTYVVRLSASNNDSDAAYEATIIVNEKTTGIAEQIELDNAIIYANGKTITVDLSNVELDGKTDLEIYNMVGKLMVQQMNVSDFEYVDMDQAVSGIYIVKIINQTASISKKVILK
jgi:PKD repeat protein